MGCYRDKAMERCILDYRTGAVTVIQRVGSALNLNPAFNPSAPLSHLLFFFLSCACAGDGAWRGMMFFAAGPLHRVVAVEKHHECRRWLALCLRLACVCHGGANAPAFVPSCSEANR